MYRIIRRSIRFIRLTKPLRGVLSPVAERLIGRMLADPDEVFIVQGHKMYLASGDGRHSVGMVVDVYEETTTRLFETLLKSGMVVVDIGAHVGYFTLIAARQVGPAGKVYAFEPDPDNYSTLLKNIEANAYDNVVADRKAISDNVGTSQLHLVATGSGRHSMYHHGLPERGSIEIETTTLDSTFDDLDWPNVDLIKIDVEGAEVSVLDGMTRLLEKPAKLNLIVEFMPSLLKNAGIAPRQFLDKLASLNSELYFIDESNGLIPIAARDGSSLVKRLLASEESGNILCTWGSIDRAALLEL